MTSRVGEPLNASVLAERPGAGHLSRAELLACVLDGALLRLGDAFIPLDQPVGLGERARAVPDVLPAQAILARGTAAWVWGATWRLADPLIGYVRPDAPGLPLDPRRARVHEVVLLPGDVTMIDAIEITSPLRTAVDLARAPIGEFDQGALARLLRLTGVSVADAEAAVRARPRLAGRRAALQRLQVLFTR